MSVAAGIDADVGQTLAAVLLGLVFVSGHRFVRPVLERAFFPGRRRLERGVEELISNLGDASTAESMLTRAARGLDALVEPESCAVYAQTDEVYENPFARGGAVPPALSPGQATLRALRERMTAVDLERLTGELPEREVALLAGGGSAVTIPVVARGELVALLVLGAKTSGDVYTSTDLALLTAVGSRLSAGFLDFDYAQFRAEARSMARNLRRYVPGAVAAVIEEGHELESEEAQWWNSTGTE